MLLEYFRLISKIENVLFVVDIASANTPTPIVIVLIEQFISRKDRDNLPVCFTGSYCKF